METPNASPLQRFHRLVQQNRSLGIDHRRRLFAIYLKMLPSGLMSTAENWRYRHRLQRFSLTRPPLYLLGHWRSGTTFLQFLLGQDNRLIYHTKFQTFFPKSFLLTEETVKPIAETFLHAFSAVGAWRDGISLDMGLDTPSEIEVSLMNEGSPVSFHWGHIFPRSWKYYFDRYLFQDGISPQEFQLWKQSVRRLNRKVQLKFPRRRLMVKNPGDTARVSSILQIYPNARFVFIHRNPYDVYYSNHKLWENILHHLALQDMPQHELPEAIRYIYRRLHLNYLAQRAQIPSGQLVEISHQQLSTEPLETAKLIYDRLQLGNFARVADRFQAYAKKRQGPYRPPQYAYRPEEVAAINRDWDFAFSAFGYPKKNLASGVNDPS